MCQLPSWNFFAATEHTGACPEGCYEADGNAGWRTVRPLHNDEPLLLVIKEGHTTVQQLVGALNTLLPGSVVRGVDAVDDDILVYVDCVA